MFAKKAILKVIALYTNQDTPQNQSDLPTFYSFSQFMNSIIKQKLIAL